MIECAAQTTGESREKSIGMGMNQIRVPPYDLPEHRGSLKSHAMGGFEQLPNPGLSDRERIPGTVRPHPLEGSGAQKVRRDDLHRNAASGKPQSKVKHVLFDSPKSRGESLCELDHPHGVRPLTRRRGTASRTGS